MITVVNFWSVRQYDDLAHGRKRSVLHEERAVNRGEEPDDDAQSVSEDGDADDERADDDAGDIEEYFAKWTIDAPRRLVPVSKRDRVSFGLEPEQALVAARFYSPEETPVVRGEKVIWCRAPMTQACKCGAGNRRCQYHREFEFVRRRAITFSRKHVLENDIAPDLGDEGIAILAHEPTKAATAVPKAR